MATSGAERRVGRHGAGRIDAFRRRRRVGEQPDGVREREVRLRRDEQRGRGAVRFVACHLFGDDDRRRARRGELRHVLFVRDEADVAGTGALDAGNAADLDVAVALQAAVQPIGKLSQLQSRPNLKSGRVKSTMRFQADGTATRSKKDDRRCSFSRAAIAATRGARSARGRSTRAARSARPPSGSYDQLITSSDCRAPRHDCRWPMKRNAK